MAAALLAVTAASPVAAANIITNGGFDAGLAGWTAGTRPDAAHGGAPALYAPAGWVVSNQTQLSGSVSLLPIDGNSAFSSFDGAPAGLQLFLAQPIAFNAPAHNANLSFTYDIAGIGGTGKQDPTTPSGLAQRSFDVVITDTLGQALAPVFHYAVPVAGDENPRQTVSMDIASTLNSLPPGGYMLEFRLTSPEANAGPALFSLDDVSLNLIANRPPSASCPDNLQVQSEGATAPVTLTGSGSDPDGDPISFEWKQGDAVLSTSRVLSLSLPPGHYVFTLVVTDSFGATGTCDVTVDVLAATPLTITCPPGQTVTGTASGAVVTYPAPTTSGGMGAATVVCSPPSGSTFPVGTTTVTCTATDTAGDRASCSFKVTVVVPGPLTLSACPQDITTGTDPGKCSAVVNYTAPTAAGGVAPVTVVCTPPPGSALPVGKTTVTCTATDGAGNHLNCTFMVTVADTEKPTISKCPGAQTASANGSCQAAVPDLRGSVMASDNCTAAGSLSITQSPAPGTQVGLGSATITLTVTDAAGNSSTCTTTFTVSDTTPPTITSCPPAQSASADSSCRAAIPDFTGGIKATDNCTPAGSLIITQSPAAGTLVGLGASTVTLTVMDAAGNSATCTTTFTVNDTTPPTITTCAPAQSASADANGQAAVPDFTKAVVAADNCTPTGSLAITQSPSAGTKVGVGNTTVTLTVTDAAGNSRTCTTSFTVSDTTPPTITACAPAQTAVADANCQAVVPDFRAGVKATDNYTPAAALLVTQSPPAGTKVGPGSTTITLTVMDAAGNRATCTTTFTVSQTTPPTITQCAPAQTAAADANCQAAVPDFTSGVKATDICTPSGSLIITQSPTAGTKVGLGKTTVTLTVTDAAGNNSTCTTTFTVSDTTPPTIIHCAPAQTAAADANCQAAVPDITKTLIATDNCTASAALLITQSPSAGTKVGLGSTTITLTVMDAAGNSTTCTTSFAVTDTTPPTITSCPPIQSASADANCQAVVPDFRAGVKATDNCTPTASLIITQSPAAGTKVGPGSNTITLTVVDGAGNSSTCTTTFTVSQTTPPTITQCAPAQTASADSTCQAVVPDFTSGVKATDVCTAPASLIITQSPLAGTKVGLGKTTVTLTVTDAAGNSSTCTTTFTVSDTTPPAITHCAPAQSTSADSSCEAVVPDFTKAVVATDNCTPSNSLAITQSPSAGTKVGPGKTTVTLTVMDAAGNSSTCTTTFTVSDTTPPTITTCASAQTAVADANCQAVVPDFKAGIKATDNCTPTASLIITQSPAAGTKVGPGSNTITLTVVDGAGNSSTCTTTFTVSQTTPPTITQCAPAQTAAADANCQAAVPDFTGAVKATDNCTASGSLMISQSPAAGTKVGLGSTTITLTVTDAAGNSATCPTTLTVSDTAPPTITTCPPARMAAADANCHAAVPDFTGAVRAMDNCTPAGSLIISQSPTAGTQVGLGATTVTLTVMDAVGNSNTCTTTFTVTDTTLPTITACAPAQSAPADGNCQAAVPDFTGEVKATDNCTASGSLMISQSPAAGTKVGLGSTTVTLTVTDAAGNSRTCTTSFTVTDTTPPTITTCAPAQTASANGSCQAAVPDFTAGIKATDNCTPTASLKITQSPAAGTLVGLGATTVTLTVMDAAGNISQPCTTTFTVSDKTAPKVTCFGDLMERVGPASCSTWTPTDDQVAALFGATAMDNCDGSVPTSFVSRSDGKGLGAPFPLGTTTITWAAVDKTGNRGTCSQSVVVTAPESWQLVCPGTYTVWVGPNDTMGALELPTQITGDNCDVQITCTPPRGTMLPVGVPTKVTCTAMDPNGRVQTCTTTVTVVQDTTPPVFTNCPTQITQKSEFSDGSALVDYGVTATDDSGFVTLYFNPEIGHLFPLGNTQVTCTAVDRFGNTNTCTFTVTITP